YECRTPVVSAVGHEVDTTIVDLVADKRATTPSEAGEIVVPDTREVLNHLEKLEDKARSSVERMVEDYARRLESHERFLEHRPPVVDEYAQRLDEIEQQMHNSVERRVENKRSAVHEKASVLESLSPLKVLSRGYSVVEKDEKVVRSVDDVSPSDPLSIRVSDGRIDAEVEGTYEDDGGNDTETP
ncbi:MAG: exodeoxyribonuclease VII large subunit, partial [Halobacteria archaeon]|nr:exodeoxyribonuclease VII large subunit [Halobacteria archaeon]